MKTTKYLDRRLGSNGGVKTFQKPVRLILAARVGKWPNLSIYYSVKEEQDSPLITQQAFSKAQPDKLYIRGKLWPVGKPLEL